VNMCLIIAYAVPFYIIYLNSCCAIRCHQQGLIYIYIYIYMNELRLDLIFVFLFFVFSFFNVCQICNFFFIIIFFFLYLQDL